MLKIEPFEIISVVNGTIRLDGGAMFGVVPKVMWQERVDVDDQNRILLATRTLLAIDRSEPRIVLVDTGCGDKWAPDKAKRFAIQHDPQAIDRALAASGFSAEDVTDVVITHLHFDHNGGVTRWVDQPGGETRLRYPQATHWIHRKHWEHAHNPHVKDRASFLAHDFASLADHDVLRFVDGDDPPPVRDDFAWRVSSGHTPYQLQPEFGSGDRRLLFAGDMIPTSNHVPLGWVMAYDMNPTTTIMEKQAVYRRCVEEGLLLAFPHDPSIGGAALTGTPDRPKIAEPLAL